MVCGRSNLFTLTISLVPFHRFSPFLKSLRVVSTSVPLSQVFNLIHSFTFLEDVALLGRDWSATDSDEGLPTAGTLGFSLCRGMINTTCRLLDLPNGIHFRKLKLLWRDVGDLQWAARLVVACSNTLEHLDMAHVLDGAVLSLPQGWTMIY